MGDLVYKLQIIEIAAILRRSEPPGCASQSPTGRVNDAPALAAADVGIAMGAAGTAAAGEAADVVLLVDRVDRVAEAIAIAWSAPMEWSGGNVSS